MVTMKKKKKKRRKKTENLQWLPMVNSPIHLFQVQRVDGVR
jgi:hypothetical protein